MSLVTPRTTDRNYLAVLRECGGYYECPKDASGRRLGPLIAFTGRYAHGKQWVGEVYYNLAAVEEDPPVLNYFALDLARKILTVMPGKPFDTIVGIPQGGVLLGLFVASQLGCRYYYPEKEVTELRSATSREKSKLVWGRHELRPGMRVVVIEDIFNNFSSTRKTLSLVQETGAKLVALAGAFNRSKQDQWEGLPVISLLHLPTDQYRQDDPYVADDLAQGNVVWDPKPEWEKLMAAMEADER